MSMSTLKKNYLHTHKIIIFKKITKMFYALKILKRKKEEENVTSRVNRKETQSRRHRVQTDTRVVSIMRLMKSSWAPCNETHTGGCTMDSFLILID